MFNEILIENSNINNYYWDSKLPRIIRRYICKYRRNKLRNKLKLFTDIERYAYRSVDIYEILSYASVQPILSFSKMKEYSLKISVIDEKDNVVFFASMEYKLDDERYAFNIISKINKLYINIITIDKHGNRREIEKIERGEDGLLMILKSKKYNDYITNILYGLAAMFSEMVNEFIEDQFTRSERIYNGK